MYLISSTKLRKAREALEAAEPFFDALRPAIARILRHIPDLNNIYFDDYERPDGVVKEEKDKVRAYLVVTADKGLAGAYNHNIIWLMTALGDGSITNCSWYISSMSTSNGMYSWRCSGRIFSITTSSATLFRMNV